MPSQRDTIKELSPPWLRTENGEKFLYTMGVMGDLLLEKMNQATRAHLPGENVDPSAIPYQAEDKLLVQGPSELNSQFTARLRRALTTWSYAGSARAVLEQMHAYLANVQPSVVATLPECLIVGGNADVSSWHWLTIDAPQGAIPNYRLAAPANWNWDGRSQPWRSWLVLFFAQQPTGLSGGDGSIDSTGGSGVPGVTSGFATVSGLAGLTSDNVLDWLNITGSHAPGPAPTQTGSWQIVDVLSATSCVVAGPSIIAPDIANGYLNWNVGHYPFIGPGPAWGSPPMVYGDFTWGVTCSPETVISIRQIIQRWKSGSTYYPYIIASFGGGDGTAGNEFSPLSSPGAGNPDGTWGGYGKNVNGVWVPSKQPLNSYTAFLDGTGRYVRCSVHNVT